MDWIYYFKNFIVIGRQKSFETNQSGNFPTIPRNNKILADLLLYTPVVYYIVVAIQYERWNSSVPTASHLYI